MAFNKFKYEIKSMSINELNKMVQERKKLLLIWNNPHQRMVELGQVNPNTNLPRTMTKHPYRKIRRELSILNNTIHNKLR